MDDTLVWGRYVYHFPSGAADVPWGPVELEIRRHVYRSERAEIIACERALFPRTLPGTFVEAERLRHLLPDYIGFLVGSLSESPTLYGFSEGTGPPGWGGIATGVQKPGEPGYSYTLVTGLNCAEVGREAEGTQVRVGSADVRGLRRVAIGTHTFELHSGIVSVRRYLAAVRGILKYVHSCGLVQIRITWESVAKGGDGGAGRG